MINTTNAETRQEKVRIITDELQKGIQALFESDKYRDYLQKMSKLHNYSFNNTVLIFMQKPDATMVAGMSTWNKAFGRTVNKGEKGLVILAPSPYKKAVEKPLRDSEGNFVFDEHGQQITKRETIEIQSFRPAYVFDVSQTSGKPVPQLGVSSLDGTVERYDTVFEALRAASPVPVSFKPINGSAKGYYSLENKEIVLDENMSQLQTLKTFVHELAHSLLHDKDTLKTTGEKKDRNTCECEAESVAFTVCSYLGLDTSDYSFGYISGWAGARKTEAVIESMETIRKCSNDIITSIERQLYPEMTLNISESRTHIKHNSIAV